MEKFNILEGIAAPMPLINIDTDMLIPKQFLKTIKRTGLGENLFFEMRYDQNGNEIKDFGIMCIISTSFADIFFNNCFKNGILPIIVSQDLHQILLRDAEMETTSIMKIDLENQKIVRNNGDQLDFEVDEFKKYCLLNGLDDIGLTLKSADKISSFEKEYSDKFSWS